MNWVFGPWAKLHNSYAHTNKSLINCMYAIVLNACIKLKLCLDRIVNLLGLLKKDKNIRTIETDFILMKLKLNFYKIT